MIRVAVCDDDVYFTSRIEELLLDYPLYKFEVDVYFDGTTLTKAIEQGIRYQLMFLDIKMKQMDGIQAAERVRSMDNDAVLIYISSYDSYMKELFSVRPLAFLQKPLFPEDFYSCMGKVLKEMDQRKVYYNYVSNFTYHKVCLKDIMYFESKSRRIFIHTMNGSECFYGKMADVEEQVEKSCIPFIRIHQSFLVNYHYISTFNANEITLYNEEVLPVSSERQKETRRKYHMLMELL